MIVWLVAGRVVVLRECRLRFADRTVCLVVRMRAVVESLLGTWYVEMMCELLRFMFSVIV